MAGGRLWTRHEDDLLFSDPPKTIEELARVLDRTTIAISSRKNKILNEKYPDRHKKKGFARLSPERRSEIAAMGGMRAHELGVAHEFNPESGQSAGSKGGKKVAQDRSHMSKIGRRGVRAKMAKREASREQQEA